jgi:hypothetical protein
VRVREKSDDRGVAAGAFQAEGQRFQSVGGHI